LTSKNNGTKDTAIIGITLSFSSAYGLMDSDPKHVFYSEQNTAFLEETGSLAAFQKFANKIGTGWSVQTKYDILFGSPKMEMPWKFHTSSQRFLVVSPGEGIRVKMTPWKSRKYMDVVYDYETFDFWARSVQEINMKCLDFDLNAGQVLYIPPYWFYSITFLSEGSGPPTNHSEEDETTKKTNISFLACFTFATPMNIAANTDAYGYALFLNTSSLSSSTSITKTIIPFSSSTSNNTKTKHKEEKDEEEKKKNHKVQKESPIIISPEDSIPTSISKIEVQEMLSVIEKPKHPILDTSKE
jgi:hypothetical protein